MFDGFLVVHALDQYSTLRHCSAYLDATERDDRQLIFVERYGTEGFAKLLKADEETVFAGVLCCPSERVDAVRAMGGCDDLYV